MVSPVTQELSIARLTPSPTTTCRRVFEQQDTIDTAKHYHIAHPSFRRKNKDEHTADPQDAQKAAGGIYRHALNIPTPARSCPQHPTSCWVMPSTSHLLLGHALNIPTPAGSCPQHPTSCWVMPSTSHLLPGHALNIPTPAGSCPQHPTSCRVMPSTSHLLPGHALNIPPPARQLPAQSSETRPDVPHHSQPEADCARADCQ